MPFYLNPIRKRRNPFINLIRFFIRPFLKTGFININYYYIHPGVSTTLTLGKRVSTMNALFNLSSGNIIIGDNTIFGHNCMLLTGLHQFSNGVRASLDSLADIQELPRFGNDIVIGSGCFIGSGSIICGGVNIGNNVIIQSGSIVVRVVPNGALVGGQPASMKTASKI